MLSLIILAYKLFQERRTLHVLRVIQCHRKTNTLKQVYVKCTDIPRMGTFL